ncbi:MAG: heme NO-binding domain-containing protein [Rubrivivax sp.]|nr:heme NO-binding domain-containing protein [Rubrivivax sp.]
MLGLVFTEFIELVEDRFSPEMADRVIAAAPGGRGGAYTAVGYYPHEELVAMVLELARISGAPVPQLVRAFGSHLLQRFTQIYPQMFERHRGLFDFLAAIDGEIHVEVRKLYPQASLPRFEVMQRSAQQLTLRYSSPRGMQSLAIGLMEGAAAHYGERCEIASRDQADGSTLFELRRVSVEQAVAV